MADGEDGIQAWVDAQGSKDLLRVVACGSVDDGKSTLVGRLLLDCGALLADQLDALRRDSRRFGSDGAGEVDPALVLDGLAAEREQGITIDVAWRHFSTPARRYVLSDAPGHEQYTKNLATAAAAADLAVLLIDAVRGATTQTRRHLRVCALMGVRSFVVAINKMDAAEWDEGAFERARADVESFAEEAGIAPGTLSFVPVSGRTGGNVARREPSAPWFQGPLLLDLLESAPPAPDLSEGPFRFPVQLVLRAGAGRRVLAGPVVSGTIRPGDEVAILPSGRTAKVASVSSGGGDLPEIRAGSSSAIVLAEDVDVGRGDVVATVRSRPEATDRLLADVVWMSDVPLAAGARLDVLLGFARAGARVASVAGLFDGEGADSLRANGLGRCELHLDRAVAFDPYAQIRATGSFLLVDRATKETVGCGMVRSADRKAASIHRYAGRIGKAERAAAAGQSPCVLWFTGLSGSGKSTVADLVEQELRARGRLTMNLDGDSVRHGLCRDLGFSREDRVENVRRVAEAAKLMLEAGLIVMVGLVSPFRADRQLAKDLFAQGEFLEVFMDAPLSLCEQRDPKGLYAKARAGTIPEFTGISSPYEPPESPDLVLDSSAKSPKELAAEVMDALSRRGLIA